MYRRKSSARMSMLVIAAVLAMALLAPVAGYASAAGNRNTAIALTGLATGTDVGTSIPTAIGGTGDATGGDT